MDLLTQAVNNVVPRVFGGGLKRRGPNNTANFIYQVWVEKALLMTDQLPQMLEECRQQNSKHKKFIESYGKQGKYTDSKGWSEDGEYIWSFDISKDLAYYFRSVVGPFLGLGKTMLEDYNSKHWKKIKKMIMNGDSVAIAKLRDGIKRKIYKEAKKRIQVGYGSDTPKIIV